MIVNALTLCCCLLPSADDPIKSKQLYDQALAKARDGELKKAIELLERSVAADPKNVAALGALGQLYSRAERHKDAVKVLTAAIELDPANAQLYNHCGSACFKLGEVKRSVALFDKFLKLRPTEFPGHWRRGISLYYAGRFDDGRKQFEGYEKVDTNDVENAVWHFLCVARKDSADKARASILKIGKDRRVPMMTVYELFKGKAKPEDVLKAAESGKASKELRNRQRFYAHLYLGLYYEAVEKDTKKALEHLTKAADDHKIGHYLWDVARVHRDLLNKAKKN